MPRNRRSQRPERELRVIDEKAPFPFVEAYKSLRTNIDFLSSTNNYHSILITSAGPWDGKSTVAINLATAMAGGGKRVVLVDCDMRKGSIASYLKIRRSAPGITDVIGGKYKLNDVIFRQKDLGFDVLPVGALPNNPAEVVGAPIMVQILQLLSGMYDYVFIDTPPVSLVTDAAILSRYVDGVILVVRADETTKQALNASKKALEDVNANILGAVLNDYDARKHSYGGGYYSYRYGKYGYKYSYKYGYGGYDRRADKKKKAKESKEEE